MHDMPTFNVKNTIKPGTPVKLTGLIYKDIVGKDGTVYKYNRYAHEAVYGIVSSMSEFQNLLAKEQSWLYSILDFDTKDRHITEAAARVAFIYRKVRANIASMHNLLSDRHDKLLPFPFNDDRVDVSLTLQAGLTPETKKSCVELLKRMFYCTPNQGVGNNLENQYSCDLYRMCPWCRYEKSLHIFKQFAPHLDKEKKVCVTHFLTPCDSSLLDINSDPKTYTKAIRHACKGKGKGKGKGWEYDFVITLPYRTQISDWQDNQADRYRLAWRTSVITIAAAGDNITTPENAFPKAKPVATTFMNNGIWYKYPATKAGLCDALRIVMEYPKMMLAQHHDENFVADILTVLKSGDRNRAVGHGFKKT